ncbi:glycosyltransferase family 8 protein [Crucibulum laeve]|uniref:Glycosyltransferase family 8 protein n=1 Tax=Crucibulum laeve TaxID=68775 RepID=A0A5C3MGF4_9AGAR|nr:glycosyltransferase family 8 protein [Crucibulum laeve]
MASRCAYVTLLTKSSYLPGTLVLDYGLRAVGSKYPLVVMATPALPAEARKVLHKCGIPIREVNTLIPEEGAHTLNNHDARFADTWTKLRAFELAEYDRIVLLDCDMIVKKNMDDLMTIELGKNEIAAVHVCACNPRKLEHYPSDWIPANCAHTAVKHPRGLPPVATDNTPRPYSQLNSGTVVLNPSRELSDDIIHFLSTHDKISEFSFPDQDLLTTFFKNQWKPLPWYYNALKTLRVIHPQEWSDDEVRCLHYILPDKPWQSRVTLPELEEQFGVVNSWWWQHLDSLGEELKVSDPEGWKLVLENVNTHPVQS